MPTPVYDIDVFMIAKTYVDHDAIEDWLESMNAGSFEYPTDSTGAEDVIGLAGKRCYNSFVPGNNPNVTKTTDVKYTWAKYLDNILASGHGSVLEHASFTFAIENCTRVFTAEMNRHRAGVGISEASLRYIRFNRDIKYFVPPSINGDDLKSEEAQEILREVFEFVEEQYSRFERIFDIDNIKDFDTKKKLTSMFRRIVPLGVCVGAGYTMNVRALRHILTMRCSPHAEEEICMVCSKIAKLMVESEPNLFGDFELKDGYWVPKYVKV